MFLCSDLVFSLVLCTSMSFFQQDMESIPISSLPMGSRVMRDPLTSRHNTITKAVSSHGICSEPSSKI